MIFRGEEVLDGSHGVGSQAFENVHAVFVADTLRSDTFRVAPHEHFREVCPIVYLFQELGHGLHDG